MHKVEYVVKGGGILRGKTKQDIAFALYELSLAPSDTFQQWMVSTCKRIHTQFGWNVSSDSPDSFVDDLELHGLIQEKVV